MLHEKATWTAMLPQNRPFRRLGITHYLIILEGLIQTQIFIGLSAETTGEEGIEPSSSLLESDILPLYDSPIVLAQAERTRLFVIVFNN